MKWFAVVCFFALCLLSSFNSPALANDRTPGSKRTGERSIAVMDAQGNKVRSAPRSPQSRIVDVAVGPGGVRIFSPSSVTIAVGDTVRWTWGSSTHTVTSGSACAVDNQYCSPNDMNCGSGITSNTGAVYSHTFGQAGLFHYFCAVHCATGMTGTVTVVAPFVSITSVTRAGNGHFLVVGQSLPNATVTITSAPDPLSAYGNPQTVSTTAAGAFQYDDASAVGQTKRFYKVSYP
jgi:plastocyanin